MIKIIKKYQTIFLFFISIFLSVFINQYIQFYIKPSQRIETLDITGMYKKFVNETAHQNLPKEKMQERVSQFAKSLDEGVLVFSKKHRSVILPSEAVVSGAKDITPDFEGWMNGRRKP